MDDLLAARSQMALSLGFHILFACVGMAMPLLMVIAEGLWHRTGDDLYRELAVRWAKGTAILFAVGAVSGTVLSFELGLLWPRFMDFAGPVVGLPFSIEGFAFFLEAIFLGIYFYGWDRVGRTAHLLAGVGVWISGMASGFFVVSVNAWMNHPQGFAYDTLDGGVTSVEPWVAMLNPAFPTQAVHMAVAAIVTTAFAVAGVHAFYLLRDPSNRFHRLALSIALPVAALSAVAQPLTGHSAGEYVAEHQPLKLAAAEAQWDDEIGAPMRLGGWPDEATETTPYAIEVPYLLSILAFGDPHAEVKGIRSFPEDERPPIAVVHLAYQVMLGLGTTMMGAGLLGMLLWWRRGSVPLDRWYLALLVALTPAGALAVEAGWTVTEVGRQPWIIRGVMRTEEAVTAMPGLGWTLSLYALLYLFLGVMTLLLLRRQFRHSPEVVDAP